MEETHTCKKGIEGCFCKVGWPYEKQCPDCRDTRQKGDNDSYCVCPPPETKPKEN